MFFYDGTNLWTDWYSQKLEPSTDAAFGVDLHNQWLNPVPNTAEGTNTGYLEVNKYVYITYWNGTVEYLVNGENIGLPACEHHKEIFNKHVERCFHKITVAVHIKGPEYVDVTKEGEVIPVKNPWVCTWQNYTWYYWGTIKEDIGGDYFDTWHGTGYVIPGGTEEYMVPMEVPAPDCKVSGYDLTLCAKAFGSYPGHPRWNSIADINGDYKVDGGDQTLIGKKYGWPPA